MRSVLEHRRCTVHVAGHGAGRTAIGAVFVAVLMAASGMLHAQTYRELERVLFHPVPLTGSAPCMSDALAGACILTRMAPEEAPIDMAMFEEVSVDRYLADIETTEDQHGPYSDMLMEKLRAAGALYQQLGKHEQALELMERAAALSRIHRGPYSTEQIELLEPTLQSLQALGLLEQLDERHDALLDIYRRVHGPQSLPVAEAMLAAGRSKRAWLEQMPAQSGAGQPVSRSADRVYEDNPFALELLEARQLFSDAIRIHVEHEAWSTPALFELEHELLRLLYLDAQRTRGMLPAHASRSSAVTARARLHARANRKELPVQYREGEQAYRRMIGYLKQDQHATVESIADVLAGLADWHLLFGEYAKARAQYDQLDSFLELAQVSDAQVQAVLEPALPKPLPLFAESPLTAPALDGESSRFGYVDVAFELGVSGAVTRLEVLGSSESADTKLQQHLVTLLRKARFRPVAGTAAVRYYFSF